MSERFYAQRDGSSYAVFDSEVTTDIDKVIMRTVSLNKADHMAATFNAITFLSHSPKSLQTLEQLVEQSRTRHRVSEPSAY